MKQVSIKLPEAVDAFTALSNMLNKNEFPFEFAWELEDILEVLDKHTKRFEKNRDELLTKYATPKGEPDQDGNRSFTINDRKEFEDGMKKLMEIKVKLEFNPIQYEMLKTIPNLTVNTHDLSVLKKHFIVKANGKTEETKQEE